MKKKSGRITSNKGIIEAVRKISYLPDRRNSSASGVTLFLQLIAGKAIREK